ncbi:MAG: hypothetical protein OSJ27_03125 [Candidatus Gastranaerophilales bacterium]|nr:hypothetical protein [Candidatus Gastranaerophilales bacterium]
MKKSSIFHALFCALFSLSKTVFPFQHPERKFKRHFAFSLVEMLMALLVASLLLAALAPVMTKRMNENIHITGEFSHNGRSVTEEIIFGGPYCNRITNDEGGNPLYCEGEYTVPQGFNNITAVAIGGGGGGGAAPNAGYMEFTTAGSTSEFKVPLMTNKIEATLISGGAGGGAGGQVEKNVDYLTAGEYTWNVPLIAKGKNVLITACGGGGGGGGTPGSGININEYQSATFAGSGGAGGYIVNQPVGLDGSATQNIIIGGGGGGGAAATSDALAVGLSGGYAAGGGGGGDGWGAKSGTPGKGGSTGGGGGVSRGTDTHFGQGGERGDISLTSNTDGQNGIRNSDTLGGSGGGAGDGGASKWGAVMQEFLPNGAGGGGGGGSITGYGGGGGGGGSAAGGGGGGGAATIFGTRNNQLVIASGGGGGGGATTDDYNYETNVQAWGNVNGVWSQINGTSFPQTIAWYGAAGGGGGGGGRGGGAGGMGARGWFSHGITGTGGANFSHNTIFGTNHCLGGYGDACGIQRVPKKGENGKPGAMRITYLDYGPGGSGGGSGQMVPVQPVSVNPNEILNVSIGIGAQGGKAGKIETTGIVGPTNGSGGNDGSEFYLIPTVLKRGSDTLLSTITNNNVQGVGAWGGCPTGEAYGPWIAPHCGCQGYITDGVTYRWLNDIYGPFNFITENGHTAGNGTTLGAAKYNNGTIGGDGGKLITPWFTCTPGKGGTLSKPKGGDGAGYGCGGGGGYGLSDGGRGSGGYARISWNMYWDTAANVYKSYTLGAGGGGASGNVIKETIRVQEGQVIKIRIGAGGIGAKVVNGEIIPATPGGTTIFGDTNFIEIKAGGGGGGMSPVVKDGILTKGEGGKPSNICSVGSRNYINNNKYCTKGTTGEVAADDGTNAQIGGLGAPFSYTFNKKTYTGQGGGGGMQATEENNSKGKNAEGVASGGGGAALLTQNYVQNQSQLIYPQGGNGAHGRIILQLWE